MSNEDKLREALAAIRDSTFRNALQLRAMAARALEACEPIPYRLTEDGRSAIAALKGKYRGMLSSADDVRADRDGDAE